VLESLALPADVQRLLLKTRNSLLWRSGIQEFDPNFVALTAEAAQWVVDRGMAVVGIDYLSIQRFADGPATHQILLGAGVVVIEGLDLSQVEPGNYELFCLPLKLKGVEGAPARVILKS
jgi:arylformamidase